MSYFVVVLFLISSFILQLPTVHAQQLPTLDLHALSERIQQAAPETQQPTYYSFYIPVVVEEETLRTQLRSIEFSTPHQRRAIRLSITGEDPLLFAKPVSLIRVGGVLLPAPETTIPEGIERFDGTKISLVPHRIYESIPEPVRTTATKETSHVTIRYDETNPARPYTFSGSYQEGSEILLPQLLHRIAEQLTIQESTEAIPLPLLRTLPQIHTENFSADTIQIKDLVATGTSDFSGSSADRIHNIETAIAIYNGIVIRAGEEFSFNTLLGPVDETTGYRKELVIKGPETIPEFGGGVCQVSSTIYRAALAGGFDITERKNHSYAVSYYEPWGSDATIYPGVVDFRFRNDSAHDLVVHAYTENDHVFFHFYGVQDGRTTTLDGPYTYGYQAPPTSVTYPVDWLAPGAKQIRQNGVTGFQAHWNRTVRMPDGEERTRTFRSNYQARPAHYYVGPEATPTEEVPAE